MSWCVSAVANGLRRVWSPAVTQVRFRFHKDKIAAGPLMRRYGYEEKILNRGLLPHVKHAKQLPGKQYIPRDSWSTERALFGQNDYIDIFNEKVHPTKILYKVPEWIRGFKGGEFHALLRKRDMLRDGDQPVLEPTAWRNMNKRIRFLHKRINTKTRNFFFKGDRLNY